ncbi:MAG: LysR family transcriptional regulator [Neisseria sp.]|nr:LysR family transcriptional regulator [Neisseria sp.]
MNKLTALNTFCTLAETLHFGETAKRLAVSPQVVTRTIGELEKMLGEVLFVRSTRQVALTDFGQAFLPKARQVLADTEKLFAHAKPTGDMAGVVRIAVPDMPLMNEIFAEFVGRLHEFPNLRIDWRCDLDLLDVVDNKIDVGIRFGTADDSRLIAKTVGSETDIIVATSDLIEHFGKPADFWDLQNYPLTALINPKTGREWAWYLSADKQFTPSGAKFVCDNLSDQLAAVRSGQAVGLLPKKLCQPYLQSGELIELFADLPRKHWDAYVYRQATTVTPPRVKWAFDTLSEIVGKRFGCG